MSGSMPVSRERGAATAELVMALPLLVAVTWVLVWMVSLGSTQARLTDAARETARAVARGETDTLAIARGQESAPAGTRITVARSADSVRVEATVDADAPLDTFGVMAAHLHAEASTQWEPCVPGC